MGTICDLGILDFSECQHWIPWRKAFGMGEGGGYVVEYIFFILYSVWKNALLYYYGIVQLIRVVDYFRRERKYTR